MKRRIPIAGVISLLLFASLSGQTRHAKESLFMTCKGLVMAGYQGWFNCEEDGAERGWTHYSKYGRFEDGSCTIDFWPEMDEYKVKYKTPFKYSDGSPAYLLSSFDESTVDHHFQWMKKYGIDGVFVQRFFSVLSSENRINHNDKVLASAIKAANRYGIAICLMYDIGSMDDSRFTLVMEEWKHMVAFRGISSGTRESGHIPERTIQD